MAVLSVNEGVVGQVFQVLTSDGSVLPTVAATGGAGGGTVPDPPPGAGLVLTSTGTTVGAYNWLVAPSGFTAGGDLSGSSSSQNVINAHMPAGTVPALGSGQSGQSPDNTSGIFAERQGNWVALGADGFITVSTLPAVVPVGAVATIVVEVHITKDADAAFTAFGFFTNRIVVRNVGGTLTNTSGGQTDQPLATNNLGTGVASAQAKVDVTTATPTIQVARPAGVPCHARMVVVDYYFGTSGV